MEFVKNIEKIKIVLLIILFWNIILTEISSAYLITIETNEKG